MKKINILTPVSGVDPQTGYPFSFDTTHRGIEVSEAIAKDLIGGGHAEAAARGRPKKTDSGAGDGTA